MVEFVSEVRRLNKESDRPGRIRDIRNRQWAYYDFVLDRIDRITAVLEAVDKFRRLSKDCHELIARGGDADLAQAVLAGAEADLFKARDALDGVRTIAKAAPTTPPGGKDGE